MILWIGLTALTALTAAALTVPLVRRYDRRSAAADKGGEIALYRGQIEALEQEVTDGILLPSEAQTARAELERRLLAAAKSGQADGNPLSERGRLIAIGLVAGWVVAGATGLYSVVGRPDLPAAQVRPQAALVPATGGGATASLPASVTPDAGTVDDMVAGLAARLGKNPDDADGWQMLGWSYFNTERYSEAAEAYSRAVALRTDDSELFSLYGETLVRAAGGAVTDGARSVFGKALALNPTDARARFFMGMAQEQDGDPAAALETWLALIDSAPPGADWLPGVQERVRELAVANGLSLDGRLSEKPAAAPGVGLLPPPSSGDRGPTAADVAAAQDMSAQDRQAMIRGMVDNLAARLADNPNDPDGWIKLIRSRMVLGDTAAAGAALTEARQVFATQPDTLVAITQAAAGLGLKVD
ncbi:c-type cytochrome biogenesis protein CcmI [Actibacterium sp.]|uniref:c-type cytochrome biogenesis protein CcmI n=1 Tax=Actibacterium sp. TaxID=1872125 RepID=UPI0035663589